MAHHLLPKELTVEQARQSATVKEIIVAVSDGMVHSDDGKGMVRKVKTVRIKNESELTPNLVMSGPKRKGEVNSYVLIDAQKAVFDAKTGEAIGCGLRGPEPKRRDFAPLLPVSEADKKLKGVDRRYI